MASSSFAERAAISRFQRLCAGVIESCWLAGAAILPLLYNPHALSGFGPGKALFARLLALLVLVAWISWRVDASSLLPAAGQFRRQARHPLILSACGLLTAYGISVAFSVNPVASIWGSPEYLDGAITWFSGFVLLAAVAYWLKTTAQVQRLVTTMIAASLPVAIYSILQRVGLDPIAFQEIEHRSFSTVGHPIYLAGYLLMIVPLTIWRVLTIVNTLRTASTSRALKISTLAFYGVVAVIQLAGFLSAESRGPLLALGAGLGFLTVGLAVQQRRWKLLASFAIFSAFVLGFLTLLAVPEGPLSSWRMLPGLYRFARTVPLPKSGDGFRPDLWKQAPKVMLAHAAQPFPTGGFDSFQRLRPWIGYGPETLQNVLPRHYTVPGPTLKIENRFHNLVWDLWASSGALGVTAFFTFICLLFNRAYQRLGWIDSKKTEAIFWVSILLGGGGGAALACMAVGVGFLGFGWLVGLAAGFTVFPLIRNFLARVATTAGTPDFPERDTLLIVLLAALVGHLVDLAFAFSVETTFVIFCLEVGFIVALLHRRMQAPSELKGGLSPARIAAKKSRPGAERISVVLPAKNWRVAGECAGPGILILLTTCFVFVQFYSDFPLTLGQVFNASFFRLKGGNQASHLAWFLILPTWLGTVFAFVADRHFASNDSLTVSRLYCLTALFSGAVGLVYSLCKGIQIVANGSFPRPGTSSETILQQSSGYEVIVLCFFVVAILGSLLLGILLGDSVEGDAPSPQFFSRRTPRIAVLICATALLISWSTVWRPLRADVTSLWAKLLASSNRPFESLPVFRRAIALNQNSPVYRRIFADTLVHCAAANPNVSQTFYAEAVSELRETQRHTAGLDEASYQLARLYLQWADHESRAEEKIRLAGLAANALDESLVFQPDSVVAWVDSATINLVFLEKTAESERQMDHARELLREQSALDWADHFRDLAFNITGPTLRQQYAAFALELYTRVDKEPSSTAETIARSHLGKGSIFMIFNQPDLALASFLQAIKPPVHATTWKAETSLARIYLTKRDFLAARQQLSNAIAHAPEDQKVNLIRMKFEVDRLP